METPHTFSPQFTPRIDTVSRGLFALARLVVIIMVGLVPLFFVPGTLAVMTGAKIFFVVLSLLMVVVIVSLGVLRNGAMSVSLAPLLVAWWGIVLMGFVSAILSPTLMPSLFGTHLEIQTVGFLAILGLVMTVPALFAEAKIGLVYIYGSLVAGAALLSLYQLVRLFAGPNFLSFGFLQGHTATVIGSFNDLGIFLALAIIISVITLIQLPLPRRSATALGVGVLLMLAVLMVINFVALWVVLALLSLSLLMYSLTKDRFNSEFSSEKLSTPVSLPLMGLIGIVFVVSTVFLIGGSSLGSVISNKIGVNYTEVRPSLAATLDIMRHVYHDNAFTGIGPNQFTNAWNLYKNSSLT